MQEAPGSKGPTDEIRELSHALEQRESLLRAVSDVAGHMLERESWDGIEESLRRLGESHDVQRVSILENRTDASGRILVSLRNEWSDPSVEQQLDKPDWLDMHWPDMGLADFERTLSAGIPLARNTADLLPDARQRLAVQGIQTVAVAPIMVEGEWWGTLAFADCRAERSWPEVELDALQTVARLFASFICRLRNEQSLRESEARYRGIVQALPDIIFRFDNEMHFIDVQSAHPEDLLVSIERTLGSKFADILPPDVAAMAEQHYRKVVTTGTMQVYEYSLELRGELRHYESRLVPCTDREMLAIVRDVTEAREAERRLRESEARYMAVVNDQTELICRFGADSVLTFVNDAYSRYFGKTKEELIGNKFMPMVPEEDQDLVNWMFSSLSPSHPFLVYEHRVYDSAGELRWVEWTDRLILGAGGEIGEYQSVGRDVTERRELQRRLLAVAEGEQKRLAQDLHDGLCQDLKGLEIEAALLEDRLVDAEADTLRRAAEVGRRANLAVRSAYNIVRGMLPVGLDARGLVPALAKLAQRSGEQAGCRITCALRKDLQPVSEIQAEHLYKIAQEALANALRHAQASEVRLGWDLEGDLAVLSVHDNGIGFDHTSPRWENRGVGLTVLETRAQAIPARLRIESSIGAGTDVRCLVKEWALSDERSRQ